MEKSLAVQKFNGEWFVKIQDVRNYVGRNLRIKIEGISPTQWPIAHLVADGFSNEEISEKLQMPVCTVKWNVSAILRAWNLKRREQVLLKVRELMRANRAPDFMAGR